VTTTHDVPNHDNPQVAVNDKKFSPFRAHVEPKFLRENAMRVFELGSR
jgi:hypothetical protein